MFTRIVLLLLVLTSTSSAQAALWFLEGSGTFTNVIRSFEYTEAGGYGALNLFPGVGDSLFVAGDATFLTAATDCCAYPTLTLKFETPLTDLGGIVSVAPFPESNFILFPPDCDNPTSFCIDTGITSVTTTPSVPLPNTAVLILAAVAGLLRVSGGKGARFARPRRHRLLA